MKSAILLAFLGLTVPTVLAQSCIPLSGSTECSAFNASSISTDTQLTALYPFLAFVSNTRQFDTQLNQYVSSTYVQLKYQQLLGCGNVNLTNTTNYYARYTTSVICNAIVQNSVKPCSLSTTDARPLCAVSCAQQATSEEEITVNSQLCSNPGPNYLSQIRADFTNCALPSDSLSQGCIIGEENEPNNCGFSANLQGLCAYCAASSPNATDSCCVGSNVNSRCTGVTLPTVSSMPTLFPSSTSSATPSSTGTTGAANGGAQPGHQLSGGQIAGIVIGSILGAALLIALLLLCCICLRRRRRGSQRGSIFNQSTSRRGTQGMVFAPQDPNQATQAGYVPPGGRVARMSALEHSSSSPSPGIPAVGGAGGAGRRGYGDTSDSDAYGDTPESRRGDVPPVTGRRNGSLSSPSALGALDDPSSPQSEGQFSSPEGVASGQSEQLATFTDYYSLEDIHPNDTVSVLWAYQPRAGDEFELERGDMLRVVGIWDDGWATGVRLNERAENYDGKRKMMRDSGVSNGSGRRGESPPPSGELKAFPLVCVCLPEHWKRAVEGKDFAASGPPPGIGS